MRSHLLVERVLTHVAHEGRDSVDVIVAHGEVQGCQTLARLRFRLRHSVADKQVY